MRRTEGPVHRGAHCVRENPDEDEGLRGRLGEQRKFDVDKVVPDGHALDDVPREGRFTRLRRSRSPRPCVA